MPSVDHHLRNSRPAPSSRSRFFSVLRLRSGRPRSIAASSNASRTQNGSRPACWSANVGSPVSSPGACGPQANSLQTAPGWILIRAGACFHAASAMRTTSAFTTHLVLAGAGRSSSGIYLPVIVEVRYVSTSTAARWGIRLISSQKTRPATCSTILQLEQQMQG